MAGEMKKLEKRALKRVKGEGPYLYCMTARNDTPKSFEFKGENDETCTLKGLGNSDLYTTYYKDITAIVSNAPVKEYEPIEESVKEHREVALHILKDHSVLPVAFGMVFKNKKVLLNTMRRVYPTLKKSINSVNNKVELGVKVVIPSGVSIEELCNGKTREEYINETESAFLETLGKVAISAKKGKLFSDKLLLNTSFLVDKDNVEEFSEVLGKLDDQYAELKTKYTGPWPAYNFVDVKIMHRGRR